MTHYGILIKDLTKSYPRKLKNHVIFGKFNIFLYFCSELVLHATNDPICAIGVEHHFDTSATPYLANQLVGRSMPWRTCTLRSLCLDGCRVGSHNVSTNGLWRLYRSLSLAN